MLNRVNVQIITCFFLDEYVSNNAALRKTHHAIPVMFVIDINSIALFGILFFLVASVLKAKLVPNFNVTTKIITLSFVPHSLKILFLTIHQAKGLVPSKDIYYKFPFLKVYFMLFLILSLFIFNSPFLLLMSMILIGCLPLLTMIPPKWKLSLYSQAIVRSFIYFLIITNNMKYFYFIYRFWHGCLTYKGFKVFTILSTLSVFFYIVVARYIFFLQIEHSVISPILLVLYLVGIFFLFLRFLTNFSFFIIPYLFCNYVDAANIMLTGIPEVADLLDKPTPPPINKALFKGLFNFHSHHYNYPPELPRSNFYRNCGLGLATVGLCVSTYACYNYRLSALAAIKQADAAMKQNDMTALQMNLIDREEYYKRHPEDIVKLTANK